MSQQPPFSLPFLLSVAIGSALGGVARYALTLVVQNKADVAFPVGTLVVNLSGCLLIGLFFELALSSGQMTETTKLLLTTGFCGGFTTFSTFSYESVLLLQQGLWQRAVLYVVVSVVGGLGALWVGTALVRAAFTNAPGGSL